MRRSSVQPDSELTLEQVDPPDERVVISEPAVQAALDLCRQSVPQPSAPDRETLRSQCLAADRPKQAAREVAEHAYDQATLSHRNEAEAGLELLEREDQRIEAEYGSVRSAKDESRRIVLNFREAAKLPPNKRREYMILTACMLAVWAAGIATIMVILQNSGLIRSVYQSVAIALAPTAGALFVAKFVTDLNTRTWHRRLKRTLGLFAILLLPAWIVLFALTFVSEATVGVDVMLEAMLGNEPSVGDGGSGSHSIVFFVVALLFEISGGASLKVALSDLVAGLDRFDIERDALRIDREHEMRASVSEQCRVRGAMAQLRGRIAELDSGREAFVDTVYGQLLNPFADTQSSAEDWPLFQHRITSN